MTIEFFQTEGMLLYDPVRNVHCRNVRRATIALFRHWREYYPIMRRFKMESSLVYGVRI